MEERDENADDSPTMRELGRQGGKIGGKRTHDLYGPEYFREIGKRGWEAVKRAKSEGEREEFGRKVSAARLEKVPEERRREISRIGNAKRWEAVRRGKEAEERGES